MVVLSSFIADPSHPQSARLGMPPGQPYVTPADDPTTFLKSPEGEAAVEALAAQLQCEPGALAYEAWERWTLHATVADAFTLWRAARAMNGAAQEEPVEVPDWLEEAQEAFAR